MPSVRTQGLAGRGTLARMRVYCSDQTHSSIDKAVILLGLGQESLRKIPSDDEFRMRPDALAAAIAEDRDNGWMPLAVVATVGTTSAWRRWCLVMSGFCVEPTRQTPSS